MLLIQIVSLIWYKQDRGSAGAEARKHFPQAFPLEPCTGPVVLHRLRFCQKGTKFMDEAEEARLLLNRARVNLGLSQQQAQREIRQREQWIQRYRVQVFQDVSELNVTNLSLSPYENGYAVSFFYDRHRSGAPFRRGHNQGYLSPASPLYGQDCLNETAFRLRPGQYGRILWNERQTYADTGGWCYLHHIYNLFCVPGDTLEKDLLTAGTPNFVYRQLAGLY